MSRLIYAGYLLLQHITELALRYTEKLVSPSSLPYRNKHASNQANKIGTIHRVSSELETPHLMCMWMRWYVCVYLHACRRI